MTSFCAQLVAKPRRNVTNYTPFTESGKTGARQPGASPARRKAVTDCHGDARLDEVLHRLDEPSLTKLVHDVTAAAQIPE
jgi:hypothetical protein